MKYKRHSVDINERGGPRGQEHVKYITVSTSGLDHSQGPWHSGATGPLPWRWRPQAVFGEAFRSSKVGADVTPAPHPTDPVAAVKDIRACSSYAGHWASKRVPVYVNHPVNEVAFAIERTRQPKSRVPRTVCPKRVKFWTLNISIIGRRRELVVAPWET